MSTLTQIALLILTILIMAMSASVVNYAWNNCTWKNLSLYMGGAVSLLISTVLFIITLVNLIK